ncbi:MAG: glycosyltransferase family 2 protein [Nitrospirae bacterium]|nr:glycosyltransferase family 2 protein [Nitrospirota bacterium]
MKLSIVIPVYNEGKTIREILDKVRIADIGNIEKEIVVVDDFSTDGSKEILRDEEKRGIKASLESVQFKVFYHERNMGKGAAIRTALGYVTGDLVIIQDADLEYAPEDYKRLLKPVLKGKADVVYGSRFTGERRNMFFWHWVGNRFLTLITNILYNTTLSDMETCYKLLRKEVIKGIRIRSNRFNFEPEITAKILKKNIKIYEVPISYTGREYDEGKKITWKDGFSALWTLVKYRFVN